MLVNRTFLTLLRAADNNKRLLDAYLLEQEKFLPLNADHLYF